MSFVLFIAVLVILIVVHELGHFLVAKLFKVRVDEFGIGYPPRAFNLGRIGETLYTLNWLPFGGFVKIFGEQKDTKMSRDDRSRALVYKPKSVQAAVLIAGVLFNILFAWFLFTSALMLGSPTAIDEATAEGRNTQLVISSVIAGSPADSEGLRAGDELLALASGADELQKLTPSAVAAFIERHAGEELTITYRRGGTTDVYETLITPAHGVIDETPGTPAIGIAMSLVALEKMPFHQAIVHGFAGTLEALKTVTVGLSAFFASLFAGGADWTQIAGPVGIAGLVGDASSVGLVYLLYFTAFISVNLAVINLIPIPALDGGRLLFLAIETAKGTPIRQGFATAMNVLGFGLIILLMVVVTYHDILRLLA